MHLCLTPNSRSPMRDWIRSITPGFALDAFRRYKKKRRNLQLKRLREQGHTITSKQLVVQLKAMGIVPGDVLLVHTAMSKMGPLLDGPKTLVDALKEVVGESGHLLMPSSPNPAMQLDYMRSLDVFDVRNSPSKLGAVTEYFRLQDGVKRSWSPTEPVCAYGPDASWFTEGHAYKPTPYDADSPFARVAQRKGKILYIGVTLINAGTSLHLLEDAVRDFPLPVYVNDAFPVNVIAPDGKKHHWNIRVHNPEVSNQRRCDDLLPLFQKAGVAEQHKLGMAPTWLFDAKGMYDCMLKWYEEDGVTMYGV